MAEHHEAVGDADAASNSLDAAFRSFQRNARIATFPPSTLQIMGELLLDHQRSADATLVLMNCAKKPAKWSLSDSNERQAVMECFYQLIDETRRSTQPWGAERLVNASMIFLAEFESDSLQTHRWEFLLQAAEVEHLAYSRKDTSQAQCVMIARAYKHAILKGLQVASSCAAGSGGDLSVEIGSRVGDLRIAMAKMLRTHARTSTEAVSTELEQLRSFMEEQLQVEGSSSAKLELGAWLWTLHRKHDEEGRFWEEREYVSTLLRESHAEANSETSELIERAGFVGEFLWTENGDARGAEDVLSCSRELLRDEDMPKHRKVSAAEVRTLALYAEFRASQRDDNEAHIIYARAAELAARMGKQELQAKILVTFGQYRLIRNDLDEAEKIFLEAHAVSPSSDPARLLYGLVLRKKRRSLEDLQRADQLIREAEVVPDHLVESRAAAMVEIDYWSKVVPGSPTSCFQADADAARVLACLAGSFLY
jgi:tetratricopeptide (TPR) repeat protein